MFGVFLAVTQRSASSCSIVIEAFSSMPRKIPTWTITSMTANATPETVVKNRVLSSSRIFVARWTIGE